MQRPRREAYFPRHRAVYRVPRPQRDESFPLHRAVETVPRPQREESFPLHRAVEYGILHKINILLPKTEDVNKKNDKGYSVLLIACKKNDNKDILDALLARKDIDITLTNDDKFTALHLLAWKGNFEGLVKVLEAFPNADVNARTDKGNTPLIMACKVNCLRIIEYLLTKGANVACKNEKNLTALHYAACNGYTECVKMLCDYGADVNCIDYKGYTPLMKASDWGFNETCAELLRRGANVNISAKHITALSTACYNNNVELLKLLVSHGASIDFPKPYSSALISCAKQGSYDCTKELIELGVDVNGRMENDKTAMDIAEEKGHMDIVRLLNEHF